MVTVYTQPTCGKCKVLKSKLESANVDFKVVEDIDVMISKGFKATPMLEVDGNIMDFAHAVKWIESGAVHNG